MHVEGHSRRGAGKGVISNQECRRDIVISRTLVGDAFCSGAKKGWYGFYGVQVSCAVPITVTTGLPGPPCCTWADAVMVIGVPFPPTQLAAPLAVMVAVFWSLEPQVSPGMLVLVEKSLKVPVAVNCTAGPAILPAAGEGVTAIEIRTGNELPQPTTNVAAQIVRTAAMSRTCILRREIRW